VAVTSLGFRGKRHRGPGRREADVLLERNETFLKSVLENLPNMIFVKDAEELRYVRLNRAGEELLGLSREELIGKNDHDLYPRKRADSLTAKDREALASHAVLDILEAVHTRAGERRFLHTRKVAVRDQDGTPRYLLGISEDITERKRAEEAAEAARQEAARANQEKSEFLSRMSHELRTPLNSILGFGQLLEMDDLEPAQREGVEHILNGGRHLLGLIDELLDISRIEAGTMTMSLEPVHLGTVLAEALSLIQPLAAESGVRVEADPAELGDLYALADQQRLKQVLINLLANAVNYNREDGRAWARCERRGERVRIAVSDTGRGMSPEQLQGLFSPFERLGAERMGVEGTGLGLALSKRLVEAMGGEIAAESELGSGTTMSIELDSAEPQTEEGTETVERPADEGDLGATEGRTILYIEDNLSNLKLVEGVMGRLGGARLIPAMQGKLGLDLARQHTPDLVLLDLHLPDIGGREVLEGLRRDPATAGIPVVVVSADATPGQVRRLLDAGANDYLTKPLDVRRLLKLVGEHLGDGSAA
jgi:PAS domain S-box-containing protein